MKHTKQDTLDPRFAKYLLESMADGVFMLNRAGEITSWNASMEKISGYSAREALGRTCTMLSFNLCLKKSCPSGIKECGIYERGAVDVKECALQHSTYWLVLAGFVGANLLQSSLTGFCPAAAILKKVDVRSGNAF